MKTRSKGKSMLPVFDSSQLQLPALPPGSGLKFNAAQAPAQGRLSHSRALMSNLEGEMSRLLEWAGDDDGHQQRRTRVYPTRSASGQHEELRYFLEGRADETCTRRGRSGASLPSRLPSVCLGSRRRRTQREVSYLSDRKQVPRDPSSVPASMIPVRHRKRVKGG